MPYQPDLLDKPHFDGRTYDPAKDQERLTSQLGRVMQAMKNGRWHTLQAISRTTGDPESSVSARLRDLRKEKFGHMEVERRRVVGTRGLWEYRLITGPNDVSTGRDTSRVHALVRDHGSQALEDGSGKGEGDPVEDDGRLHSGGSVFGY